MLASVEAAGLTLSTSGDGGLHIQPTPPAALLDLLRRFKADILAALAAEDLAQRRREWRDKVEAAFVRHEHIEPDPAVEAAALREGWVRHLDGHWDFPAAWARIQSPTSESELRPLTAAEVAQIRLPGAPMPTGVIFGEDANRRWRRLS